VTNDWFKTTPPWIDFSYRLTEEQVSSLAAWNWKRGDPHIKPTVTGKHPDAMINVREEPREENDWYQSNDSSDQSGW